MTDKLIIASALIVASLVSVSAFAAAVTATPQVQRTPPEVKEPVWYLSCKVVGDGEFPHDIEIRNSGPDAVRAGSKIRWRVGNETGEHTFAQGMRVWQNVRLRDVHRGAPPGTRCTAEKSSRSGMRSTDPDVSRAPLNVRDHWHVSCRVEYRDIVFTVDGRAVVPMGTDLRWRVGAETGKFHVGGDLRPGWGVRYGNVLSAPPADPATPCTVSEAK